MRKTNEDPDDKRARHEAAIAEAREQLGGRASVRQVAELEAAAVARSDAEMADATLEHHDEDSSSTPTPPPPGRTFRSPDRA